MSSNHTLGHPKKYHHYVIFIVLAIVAWASYVAYKMDDFAAINYQFQQQNGFSAFNTGQALGLGIIFGFFSAVALCSLISYLCTRHYKFLLLSLFTFCLQLSIASLTGLLMYVWPDNLWLASHGVCVLIMVSCLWAVILISRLFNVQKHAPAIHYVTQYFIIALGVSTVAACIIPTSMLMQSGVTILCIGIILLWAKCIWFGLIQTRSSKHYSLAWSFLLLSALLAGLNRLELIALPFQSLYLLITGAIVTISLLTFMLTREYHLQQKQLFSASQKKLSEQKELRKKQEEEQQELEYNVTERTLELEVTLRELSETNRELEELNTIDPLTGIRNRRYFDKKYIAEIRRSRREQTALSVAMVDIDHFKKVNDQYGHLVGDECIRFVAQSIAEYLKRPSDDVCRYGGEEFSVLLPGTVQQGASELMEQLTDFIRRTPAPSSAGDIQLTISIGIATQIQQINHQDFELLEAADKALYHAKNNGRNQIVLSADNLTQPDD